MRRRRADAHPLFGILRQAIAPRLTAVTKAADRRNAGDIDGGQRARRHKR